MQCVDLVPFQGGWVQIANCFQVRMLVGSNVTQEVHIVVDAWRRQMLLNPVFGIIHNLMMEG